MDETADPIVNALNRPYWEAAARGELVLPCCAATGVAFWPPGPISPFVDAGVEWRAVDPHGTVRALAVYRRGFQQAFAARLPYGIALVTLACGVRLLAHVPSADDPAAPRPGDAVRLRFERVAGAAPLLVAEALTS